MDRLTPSQKEELRELFIETRGVLTPRSSWCTGTIAQDSCGNEVEPTDSSATCFCLVGALEHLTAKNAPYKTALELLHSIIQRDDYYDLPGLPSDALMEWNDGFAEHRDVLNLLTKGANACL